MKIRELLSSPDKWTKGAFARGPAGRVAPFDSDSAVAFCLLGAIARCYPKSNGETSAISERVERHLCVGGYDFAISDWNDAPKTKFEDVRKLVEELDI